VTKQYGNFLLSGQFLQNLDTLP